MAALSVNSFETSQRPLRPGMFTVQQKTILVGFMENHSEFVKSDDRPWKEISGGRRVLWEQLTEDLNACAPFPRTREAYQAKWRKWKYSIKELAKKMAQEKQDGRPQKAKMGPFDKRILALIGNEIFKTTGDVTDTEGLAKSGPESNLVQNGTELQSIEKESAQSLSRSSSPLGQVSAKPQQSKEKSVPVSMNTEDPQRSTPMLIVQATEAISSQRELVESFRACRDQAENLKALGSQILQRLTESNQVKVPVFQTSLENGSQTPPSTLVSEVTVEKDLSESSPAPLLLASLTRPSPSPEKRKRMNETNALKMDIEDCMPNIVKVWGEKLLTLNPQQRMFAEKAINDVLFEASLGNLNRHSVKINEDHQITPVQYFTSTSEGTNIVPVILPAKEIKQEVISIVE